MITVITLNPCIDRTVTVDCFREGSTNRAVGTRSDIGGKGINVSLVLKTLHIEHTNLLIDYTVGNNCISDFLKSKGVCVQSVHCSNALRMNLKIIDKSTSVMTEINESGALLDGNTINRFMSVFNELLDDTSCLVVCGSIPVGTDPDIYGQMIAEAGKRGIKTVLDSSSKAFSHAVESRPTLIKPNRQELSEYTDCNITSPVEIIKAGKKLTAKGIEYVCVSDGENGAYLITEDEIYFTEGEKIKVASPQGAGDSMVAALAKGLSKNEAPEEMLKNAVAAAQSTVMREGTLLCTEETYLKLRDKICVRKLTFD